MNPFWWLSWKSVHCQLWKLPCKTNFLIFEFMLQFKRVKDWEIGVTSLGCGHFFIVPEVWSFGEKMNTMYMRLGWGIGSLSESWSTGGSVSIIATSNSSNWKSRKSAAETTSWSTDPTCKCETSAMFCRFGNGLSQSPFAHLFLLHGLATPALSFPEGLKGSKAGNFG